MYGENIVFENIIVCLKHNNIGTIKILRILSKLELFMPIKKNRAYLLKYLNTCNNNI